MDHAAFEALVVAGVEALPEQFRELLSNVAIVIEDQPSEEVAAAFGDGDLFGLYEGVPVPERGSEYAELPDRITIFKEPILARYTAPDDIKECVENTVWHEIAHHFGYDEAWVAAEEIRRGKTK